MSFADQIDGVFDVREYEEGDAVQRGRLRRDRAAARALLRADVRPARQRTTAARSPTRATPARAPNLADLARDADVFLCEATLREPEPAERGHLSEDEAVDAFRASGARRLVVIHRPDELPLDPSVERAADGDVLTF